MRKVMHILARGGIGGIEFLMADYARYSRHENHFIVLKGHNESMTEKIRSYNVPVLELGLTKKLDIAAYSTIKKYCLEHDIDTVIEHHSTPLGRIYMMALKQQIPKLRTIAYTHCNAEYLCGNNYEKRCNPIKWILKLSLKRVDAIAAISNFVKESIIRVFHMPEEKIHVIYNGTDISRFINAHRKKNDDMRLIYVGRLIEDKGVQLTLRALARIKTDKQWSFRIIGDGAYRGELERLTRELGLTEKVEFAGERADVPEQLANSDVFIHMPVCEEGFGITIIEAMAAGMVCVCGSNGAIPEIITDGRDGFIAERHNVDALAKKLTTVIDNFEDMKIDEIRKNARLRAADFSIEKFAGGLDSLCEE